MRCVLLAPLPIHATSVRRRRGEGGGVGRSGQGPPHAPLGRAISGAIFEARQYRQGMRAVPSVPNLPAPYSPLFQPTDSFIYYTVQCT